MPADGIRSEGTRQKRSYQPLLTANEGWQPASALPRASNQDGAPGGRKGAGCRAAQREARPARRRRRRRPALRPPPAPPLTRHADSSASLLGPCRRGLPSGPAPRTNGLNPASPPAHHPTRGGGGNFPTSRGPPPARPRSAWACAGQRPSPGAVEEGCELRAGTAVREAAALFLSFLQSSLVCSISDCKLQAFRKDKPRCFPKHSLPLWLPPLLQPTALLNRPRQRHPGNSVPQNRSPLHKENVVTRVCSVC